MTHRHEFTVGVRGTDRAAAAWPTRPASSSAAERRAHPVGERAVLAEQARAAEIQRPRDLARRLHHLAARELLAREVELLAVPEPVPVVHALARAVGVADLG